MDDVLARLCELSVAAPSSAIVAEAQHLWKTIETLVATQSPDDLRVHDAAFSRLLACAHCVLRRPDVWHTETDGAAVGGRSIHEVATRVLVKIGCRGEDERDAILREGAVSLLVESLHTDGESQLNAAEIASALHLFQTLAFDTKHRVELMKSGALSVVLGVMRDAVESSSIQAIGCKFLQYMAYEEAAKEFIILNQGVTILLVALEAFADNEQLATSASDVLYSLSLDLETLVVHDESKFVAIMEAISENMIALMKKHPKIQPIQTHGVATLLTFAGCHVSARVFLNSLADPTILWEICAVSIASNEDAAADTIQLLEVIMETQGCYELLRSATASVGLEQDGSGECDIRKHLRLLIARLESNRIGPQCSERAGTIRNLCNQLQAIVDGLPVQGKFSQAQLGKHSDMAIAGHKGTGLQGTDKTTHSLQSGSGSSLLDQADHPREESRNERDDSNRYLDQESPGKGCSYGFFDQFVRDVEDSARSKGQQSACDRSDRHRRGAEAGPVVGSASDPPIAKNWEHECKRLRSEYKDLEGEFQVLQQSYQVVVRRAQEQSKLLNIQNSRLKHHTEVHQRVLDQVKKLENALEDARRKHQVERELRLAEVAQSEKISLSLHEAMKEISTLNKQNSSNSRELQERERLRVDFQQKASAVRQQQQKLEYERNDAVTQMVYMRNEQFELSKRLEDARREANEALLMREEDVDAPKPTSFCEMLSLSPSSRSRKVSNYTLTTKRVTQEASERQLRHQEHRKSMYAGSINRAVRPVNGSVMRHASLCGGQVFSDRTNGSVGIVNVNGTTDIDDDYMMEPPKEDAFGIPTPVPLQRSIDKFEIERTLRLVYEGFDKSPDNNGVHVATVRRFFIDVNIVQPPLVPGDVDTILTRVLNQAHENRKRVIARKDFTVSTFSGGIGTSSAIKRGNETKRFRYFDEESFFEATTLLVMRRFPRFEPKTALEIFITDYVHPMQRQQQHQLLILQRRSSTGSAPSTSTSKQGTCMSMRSGSMSGSGSVLCGNNSPTAACIGILKAVLNGLALHVGQEAVGKPKEDARYHANHESSSILLTSSQHTVKPRREDIIYSMLEMHSVLAREYKPLATICEFYSATHHTTRDLTLKDEAAMPLTFELLLLFAMDFEIIPSFMDRLSLKHLHLEVSGFLKTYMNLQKKLPPPHSVDTEMLKKVAFSMLIARLAMELFSTKRDYETPEKQITALLQWLDNSAGRDKIQKKAMLPVVIKFSRKLYAVRA